MSKINMPGFTAEASLHKTSEHYPNSKVIMSCRVVIPQIRGGLNPGPQATRGVSPGDRFCLCPCCLCVWTGFGIECSCC
jgi:hypothetical protein